MLYKEGSNTVNSKTEHWKNETKFGTKWMVPFFLLLKKEKGPNSNFAECSSPTPLPTPAPPRPLYLQAPESSLVAVWKNRCCPAAFPCKRTHCSTSPQSVIPALTGPRHDTQLDPHPRHSSQKSAYLGEKKGMGERERGKVSTLNQPT